MLRLNLCHVDTCLPDYWAGHPAAHVSIPVHRGMTGDNIKRALYEALDSGCFGGSLEPSVMETPEWFVACQKAVDEAGIVDAREYFPDLPEYTDDDAGDSIYAYFLFLNDPGETVTA